MNFYIRTNYGRSVGLGHISRVSSILNGLNKNSHKFLIFADKFDKKVAYLINNHKIKSLYSKNKKFKNQHHDARIFLSKIQNLPKGIVIVDDYRIGFIWEKYISNFCHKVIAIDDFINRKHFVDVLINTKPSLLKIDQKKFSNLKLINKKGCKFLLGPTYAPISSKSKLRKRSTSKFNLIFYNGGTGNILIYKKIIIQILKKYNFKKKILIHLIVGLLAQNSKKVKKVFSKNKQIKIHQNLNDLSKLLSNSQLLIASAGLISLESAFYKLPTILIETAKNQNVDKVSMQSMGHYFYFKKKNLLNDKKFSELVISIIGKYDKIKKLCLKSKFKIDGNGIKRILAVILNKKK